MKDISLGLRDFLKSHPRMALRPAKSTAIIIEGFYDFVANDDQGKTVKDEYKLRFEVPSDFPNELPIVFEIGQRIPRTPDNHVNPDGSLCLGSPLRLKVFANKDKSLSGFASNCVFPFLYANSIGSFLFGELSHGIAGLVEDYKDIFGVQTEIQVVQCLTLASLRRRVANKRKCPCGCNSRLGVCQFREKINNLRKLAPLTCFLWKYL